MADSRAIWIETGYEIFALKGQSGLKIEPLAKLVGKNKSSFYHHFADLDLFIDDLLNHHIAQSYIIAEKERNAKNIDPELIDIIVEHKIDTLFNRQLRINRASRGFMAVLEKSTAIIGNDFVLLWVKDMNLKINPKKLEGIFELALENFYLKINADHLNHQWLADHFINLKRIIRNLAET